MALHKRGNHHCGGCQLSKALHLTVQLLQTFLHRSRAADRPRLPAQLRLSVKGSALTIELVSNLCMQLSAVLSSSDMVQRDIAEHK